MTSPLLIDVPAQLETERLLMRLPKNGDGQDVYEAVVESLPQLREWGSSLPWAMFAPSVGASESFCRDAQANFIRRTALPYLVYSKESGRLIGSCSLHGIDWSVPRFELGYWCRTSQHGRGFTTEVIRALSSLAFRLGAQRVYCIVDEANHASRRVCEKSGLLLEGVLRNERRGVNGELRNTCVYAITSQS